MKPLVIFDPSPIRNEYFSLMYARALRAYCADNSIPMREVDTLEGLKDSTLLVNGDHLTPERISQLSESNTLVSFDINDNTLLTDSHRNSEEVSLIDLIFKIGGIQKQNESQDLSIDQDFNFSLRPRTFLPEADWNRYKALSDASRLQSLPYVPWNHQEAPKRSYSERSGNVLVRGGNHFYRFITFLNLAKLGRADAGCSFATADYFRRDMVEQFRNCESCIANRDRYQKAEFYGRDRPSGCTSPAKWGGECVEDLETYETANKWNNRCPRSFFWLTEQFEKKHGPVDHNLIERALNGTYQSAEAFYESLAQATFYTDLKWLFSIYCPPRFWEAANAGTINLLPRRTNEQKYFPCINAGGEYVTYLEDFTNMAEKIDSVSEDDFKFITGNAKDLYEGWIKPGRYPISERLCRHILTEIERVSETV